MIVSIALLAALIIVIIMDRRERKDLYNRIMAGTLSEYRSTKPPKNPKTKQQKMREEWRGERSGE